MAKRRLAYLQRRRFSGARLRARRKKLGYGTNEVLARLWRMGHKKASAQLLYAYETDASVPGIEYALSLATILKCKVEHLTEKEGEAQ